MKEFRISYDDSVNDARMQVSYYLSQDILTSEAEVLAPDLYSDASMLRWLWRRACSRLADAVRGLATVDMEEVRSPDGVVADLLLFSLSLPATPRSLRHLEQLSGFAIGSYMAYCWLLSVNRRDAGHLFECFESAVVEIRRILLQPPLSKPVRRPCFPF